MIKAVLWDFGGVILSSPLEAMRHYEEQAGLPPGLLTKVISTEPDTNAWARLERNEVSTGEFCALFEAEVEAVGHRVDARAI
ncbi:MAG TPA: HAD family hydrolase, partial [Acidimicrobiales bacterium]